VNAFEWLEQTPFAIWVGESLWSYPILIGSHAIGLAIVVGTLTIVDLRLLNRFPGIPIDSLKDLIKLAWAGFIINGLSGAALFTSQATVFVTNRPFLIKISLIFIAAISTAIIQQKLRDSGDQWDDGSIPGSVKGLAALSIFCWLGAIIAGRLTAYIA
jgi:hypothetical protein